MPIPGVSNFAEDGTVDSSTTLADGSIQMTLTLGSVLSAEQENVVIVNASAVGAPRRRGTLIVGSEVIHYGEFEHDEPTHFYFLHRSNPVAHEAGEAVLICGPPRFSNPAIQDGLVATQQALIERTPSALALTNQSEIIPTTLLFSVATSGLYRVSAYIVMTIIDTSLGEKPLDLAISWTDDAQARTAYIFGGAAPTVDTTGYGTGALIVRALEETLINYSVEISDNLDDGRYSLFISVEKL